MALKNNEVPEFEIDDDLLLLEREIVMEDAADGESDQPVPARAAKASAGLKQHKFIDYTRALDAKVKFLLADNRNFCDLFLYLLVPF